MTTTQKRSIKKKNHAPINFIVRLQLADDNLPFYAVNCETYEEAMQKVRDMHDFLMKDDLPSVFVGARIEYVEL